MLPAVSGLDNQLSYWNTTGAVKVFVHPVELAWLDLIDPQARVLDYGCGYGRLTGLLTERGYANVEGVDVASELVARAREEWPSWRFTLLADPPQLACPDGSVDAVLLFAVLTCVPTDAGQRELIAELRRVLRPGGCLYVSDLCLQSDQRNRSRYEVFAGKYGVYGVFETGDGAVCRHHSFEWLHDLLTDLDLVATREVRVDTMNGNPAQATQFLVSRI